MRFSRILVNVSVALTVIVVAQWVGVIPASAQGDASDPSTGEDSVGPGNGTRKVRSGGGAEGRDIWTDLEVINSLGSLGGEVRPVTPAWLLACTWDQWSFLEQEVYFSQFSEGSPTAESLRAVGSDPDEVWNVVFCPVSSESFRANPGVLLTGVLGTWPVGDSPPQVVIDWLVSRAYASVQLPLQVGQGAPFGDDDAPMITQLPTWLWVDDAVWAPVSVTSPPLFGITATVTATPVNVTFNGAGESVDCGPNLGPVYDFSRSGEDQSSDCTITYRHSSATDDWDLASTITWEISYSCSIACSVAPFADLVVPNSRPVTVAELQAVLVASGA